MKQIYYPKILSQKSWQNDGESIIFLNLVLAAHSEKEDHSESYDEITFQSLYCFSDTLNVSNIVHTYDRKIEEDSIQFEFLAYELPT